MSSAPRTADPDYSPVDVSPVDLMNPEIHQGDFLQPFFSELRALAPLWWHPPRADRPGFWVVSRLHDVRKMYQDTTHLTSSRGNMLSTLIRGGDAAGNKMLVVTDGPRHTALRSILAGGIGPRVLEAVTALVTTSAERAVVSGCERTKIDFVDDVAAVIPLLAICELLGVPECDRPRVLSLTRAAMDAEHESRSSLEARIAKSEILQYYAGLSARRRAAPGADVVSLIAGCEIDGKPLSPEEVLLNCYNLVIGGDETTRLAIAEGVLAFAQHEDQWDIFRARPELIDSAVEEVLRWSTPVKHVGRTVRRTFTVHGATMDEYDTVTLWNTSANRDERAFEEPARFKISRSPNRHVAFGHARHFCLGAQLARIELRAVLDALRRHVRHVEVAGPVGRLSSSFLNGITCLPMSLAGIRS